jgi:hypothetical protein
VICCLLPWLLHLQAFVPLFVVVVLQDVHLKMGIVLSAALCICLAVGNYWFHRMQVVKVRASVIIACRTSMRCVQNLSFPFMLDNTG